jgi:radical SAM superfamily enzyme YgiQ (UPF0313 family)
MEDHKIPLYCVHFVKEYIPLSLGMILANAKKELDNNQFDLTPRFISSMSELKESIEFDRPSIFLYSDYIWNIESHLQASSYIKETMSTSINIHGGPSFPSYAQECDEFLRRHSHIDYGVVGEGEATFVELASHLIELKKPPLTVQGLRFIHENVYIDTGDRPRSTNLDAFPSPYLTGIFNDVYENATYAVLETNRGCPYGCTFCDWGSATQQKIKCFSLDRIRDEIDWISKNRMSDLFVADSNFGIFERDLEITKMICDAKNRTGFPERIVLSYAKNTKKHLTDIVELLDNCGLISSGVLSIQSRDINTLESIQRKNIKSDEFDKLQAEFNDLELPLDTHLMLGLPGSTMESFKDDLRHYFFKDINVRVFNTVLLVNSPMADPVYKSKFKIETDESGTIVSTSTMSRNELRLAEKLARMYRCAHDYGMLRYFLTFLCWDYKIDPIEFLFQMLLDFSGMTDFDTSDMNHLNSLCNYEVPLQSALMNFRHTPDDLDPLNTAASPLTLIQATHIDFRENLRVRGEWHEFYDQIMVYCERRYSLTNTSDVQSCLAVQEALMPNLTRQYPFSVDIRNDFSTYYINMSKDASDSGPSLSDYENSSFVVDDPMLLSQTGSFRQDWSLTDIWQLPSKLPGAGRSTLHRFVKSFNEMNFISEVAE